MINHHKKPSVYRIILGVSQAPLLICEVSSLLWYATPVSKDFVLNFSIEYYTAHIAIIAAARFVLTPCLPIVWRNLMPSKMLSFVGKDG